MSTRTTVYQGALAPEAYELTVTAPSGVDLTTASGFTLHVRTPTAETVTWSVVASGVTATTAVLTHLFQAGETDIPGAYSIYASFNISGGSLRTNTQVLWVLEQFALNT